MTKPIDRKLFLEVGRRLLPEIDRREQRVPCQTTVVFRFRGESHYGKSVDVSVGGIFLETDSMLEPGDILQVSFSLPGQNEPITDLKAIVAWVNSLESPSRSSYPTGAGLEFSAVSFRDRSLLSAFVEQTAASQPALQGAFPGQEQVNSGSV